LATTHVLAKSKSTALHRRILADIKNTLKLFYSFHLKVHEKLKRTKKRF